MKNLMIDKSGHEGDFIPLFSGEEICAPGHSFGPFVRDYYLIHFCISGKGTLYDKYGEHNIGAGQLFVIRESETTTYVADGNDPWHYLWIATLGSRADELEELPSVAECDPDLIDRLKKTVDKSETRPEIYCAYLYELYYLLSKKSEEDKNDKISSIRRYIKYNYMLDITVDSISRLFGFERSYLYRIFKRRYGLGVKEYIIKVRLDKAKELLRRGSSVSSTAELVGYSDEFAFSKAFKKYTNMSPLVYKNSENQSNSPG